jgi:DNA (cytosine-5)-methyltransferase 1
MKVLNLYAGLGGNRKNWKDCEVTAVEIDTRIAAVYQRQHPQDNLVIGDAHEYLRQHYASFDFIWSSPPCQTHSKMAKATRHKLRRYPDMTLYEEIIFLRHFFSGLWVVENVVPFYTPLIPGKRLGRHMFWANFDFEVCDVPRPQGFINRADLAGKQALMDWLGIYYEENIYYGNNHCPAQILRNCVHPKVGEGIFNSALRLNKTRRLNG